MRRVDKLIVHCAATPEGRHHTAAEIDAWHKERGFRCIGYHYVVLLDGKVEAGRGEDEVGAHCTGENTNSIGVCYIGGCDKNMNPKDTRTPEQKKALVALLTSLKEKYRDATIHGHREFAAKACPSFDAAAEYTDLGITESDDSDIEDEDEHFVSIDEQFELPETENIIEEIPQLKEILGEQAAAESNRTDRNGCLAWFLANEKIYG